MPAPRPFQSRGEFGSRTERPGERVGREVGRREEASVDRGLEVSERPRAVAEDDPVVGRVARDLGQHRARVHAATRSGAGSTDRRPRSQSVIRTVPTMLPITFTVVLPMSTRR